MEYTKMRRSFWLLLPLAVLASAPVAAQDPVERIEIWRERAAPRGWLGVQFEDDGGGPVYVREVFPGSPAERAGVTQGDTLLRLDGKTARMEVVRGLRLAPGDTVRLQLRRAGRTRDAVVVAGERSPRTIVVRTGGRERVLDVDSIRDLVAVRIDTLTTHLDSVFVRMDSLRHHIRRVRPGRRLMVEMDNLIERGLPETLPFSIEIGSRALAGAEFTQLNPGLGRYFRTSKGLLTLRVAPGSPAARAGLEAGDVVLRVEGKEVETLRDLRQAVVRARRERVRLEVLREGKRREIELRWDR
jgi:C-terminal processing protease CtpA/Prc